MYIRKGICRFHSTHDLTSQVGRDGAGKWLSALEEFFFFSKEKTCKKMMFMLWKYLQDFRENPEGGIVSMVGIKFVEKWRDKWNICLYT